MNVMAIKNKDGTVYKLKGPNPLMKSQKAWKKDEKFQVHNFDWTPEVVKDDGEKAKPHKTDFQVKASAVVLEPVKIQPPELELEEEIEIVSEIKPQASSQKFNNSIQIHCLPASIKIHRDELYDEIRHRTTYGNKFKFEAIVVESEDMLFRFWTNVDNIGAGSIVFPQTHDKRWWKISSKQEKAGGFIYECFPSDEMPDFS